MNEYRLECKTIASHPSQNRKWYTFAKADDPAAAKAIVRGYRPGEQTEFLSVWLKVEGDSPAFALKER